MMELESQDWARRQGTGPHTGGPKVYTAVLDLGEIMICGLDFPKYFLILRNVLL